MDQQGSRFLQLRIEKGDPKEIQLFDELFGNLLRLCNDVFGNYVIQKLFEFGGKVMQYKLIEEIIDGNLEFGR